ncbi:MAG TPA: hypothetical protein VHE35_17700 [Kofleriaceae bacterium]|nr:hypothetical protein [Kofleriaceae bacterium]
MTVRRTWWHLEGLGRAPTEYERVSTKLLYYPGRGFEVDTPVAAWYRRHQQGSPLSAPDWDGFVDPRETTYRGYVARQTAKEARVDERWRVAAETGADHRLTAAWLAALEEVLPVLRFPVHGLQMAAAYVGHMAPGGRLVIAAGLEAADELRRVERIAQRMRLVQRVRAGFGETSKAAWQTAPRWQPWRQVVERLLVTYDWGEALVALGLVVKPAFDAQFGVQLARRAERARDVALAVMLASFADDLRWHHAWAQAAVAFAIEAAPANRDVIEGWRARWQPPVDAAVAAMAPWFEEEAP